MMNKLAYPKYKVLENNWIQQIPEHWNLLPGLAVFDENKNKNPCLFENQVLSLSYGRIVIKPKEKLHGLVPESFATYQIVKDGDIIIRPTDLQNDKTSLRVGISRNKGIITSAYISLKTKPAHHKNFIFRLLQSYDFLKIFYGLGSGLRQNLDFKDLKRLPIMIPPLEEQENICRYLDKAEVQINKFIQKKKRLIELLKEQKQVIINQAVTRGLDSNPRLKPSGIDWLGDIPENWKVAPLKRIVAINKSNLSEKTHPFHEFQYVDISAVGSGYLKQKLVSYQFKDAPSRARRIVSSGDILLSTVRTYLRAIWYNESQQNLIASTGFAVLSPGKETLPEFLGYRVQGNDFIDQIVRLSTGIAYPAINETILGSIKLAIPNTITEQEKIYSHIYENTKNYDVLIARYVKEIHLIQEYRTRLISDVVTGQIDVRNIEITDIVEEERIKDIFEEEQEDESLELVGAGDDD